MKTILLYLYAKGTVIGFITAISKLLNDIRTNNFEWRVFLTDLFATPLMGYIAFELVKDIDSISHWQKVVFTIFMSLNTFVVLKLATNPNLVKAMIGSWLKVDKEALKEN